MTSAVKEIHQTSDHFTSMFKKFHADFEQMELCDVTLIADDYTSISAHRLVLSPASDYFAAMSRVPLNEAEEAEIPLHGVPGDVLHNLLLYGYTAINLNTDNVERIFLNHAVINHTDLEKLLASMIWSCMMRKLCSIKYVHQIAID